MSKEYVQVNLSFIPFNPELLSGMLEILGVEGVLQEENYLLAFFKEFDESSEEELKKFLNSMKKELLIESFNYTIDRLANKNWNEEWEKSIEAIKVSEKFVIKPSFKEYIKKGDEIVLTIDPKMSFGTGYHQTTRIMIKLIEKYIKKDALVLDVGTGTGILGIISAILGAKKVITFDNDEVCEENALENIQQNNVESIVSFIVGEIKDVKENEFDLILANINRNILIDISEEIAKRIKRDGIVILSGILTEDEDIIKESYKQQGLSYLETFSEDEWIGVVFRKD